MPKTYINDLAESIKSEQERVQKILEDDEKMDKGINFITSSINYKVEKQEDKSKMNMRDRLLAGLNK